MLFRPERFLQREIDFYKHLDFPAKGPIIQRYEQLRHENTADTPLLKIGFGSGFHGVTGDYQYPDHVSSLRTQQHGKKVKTRRLAFTWDERRGEYVFHPLGYVQLLASEQAKLYLSRVVSQPKPFNHLVASAKVDPIVEQAKETNTNPPSTAAKQPEATQSAGPRLVTKTTKQLKKGVKVLARVTGQSGVNIICQPLLRGYEKVYVSTRYPAGFPVGTLVQIIVKLEGDKLVALNGAKKM